MTYQADRPFTIYFVRHGITEPNFRGFRCGGDLDLPMMDIGCDQAYLLAKQIEKMHLRIGVIIAGSLIRTRYGEPFLTTEMMRVDDVGSLEVATF